MPPGALFDKGWSQYPFLRLVLLHRHNSSLKLESDCSEEENLEGKLFMPRENFHFPRLDSCLTERSEVRQSKSRKMEILSRHGKLPERFSSEE